MNADKKCKAVRLLSLLREALEGSKGSSGVADALEAIDDAVKVLDDEKASYKASDYAVARARAKIGRLVGYRTLALSDQSRAAWNGFKDFVYVDARDDLRGVGGMNLG